MLTTRKRNSIAMPASMYVVEDDLLHLVDGLGRREQLPSASAARYLLAAARKPIAGFSWKTFCQPAVRVQASSQRVGRMVTGKALALHLEQHHRGQHQGDAGEHLVGDAEQRPQGVDAAQRIDHALVEEASPRR